LIGNSGILADVVLVYPSFFGIQNQNLHQKCMFFFQEKYKHRNHGTGYISGYMIGNLEVY